MATLGKRHLGLIVASCSLQTLTKHLPVSGLCSKPLRVPDEKESWRLHPNEERPSVQQGMLDERCLSLQKPSISLNKSQASGSEPILSEIYGATVKQSLDQSPPHSTLDSDV